MLATMPVSAALSDWREQTRLMIGAASVSVVLIGSILFLIVQRLLWQRRDSERRISLEKESLDTAINAMSLGLVLFDSENRLVVCNQRYIAMYDLSPDVAKRGCGLREFCSITRTPGHCNPMSIRIARAPWRAWPWKGSLSFASETDVRSRSRTRRQ